MPEGSLSKIGMKKALAEEANQRLGVDFFVPSFKGFLKTNLAGNVFRGVYSPSPYLLGDLTGTLCYVDDNTFGICDHYGSPAGADKSRWLELTRDRVINWQLAAEGVATGIDYNPHTNTFLCTDDVGKIHEVDRSGTILRTVTAFGARILNLAWLRGGRWDKRTWDLGTDERLILVSGEGQHWIGLGDFAGNLNWEFGAWGVPGAADNRLHSPVNSGIVADLHGGLESYICIADSFNNRVMIVKYSDKSLVYKFPYPYPREANWTNDGRLIVCSSNEYLSPPIITQPREYLSSGIYSGTWIALPLGDDVLAVRKMKILTVSEEYVGEGLIEYDLEKIAALWAKSRRMVWFDEEATIAAATVTSRPLIKFPFNVTIYALSTQDATLYVDVWRKEETWNQYDTVALVADQLTPYSMTADAWIIRSRVTMGGVDGNVSLWATVTPRVGT